MRVDGAGKSQGFDCGAGAGELTVWRSGDVKETVL